MRVSPLLCGSSSVSHEVRAWGTNGTHTGPGAGAWVPPSGLSDLSDPPSKRTHDSPHCPIDQNSVAPVSPQEECWSLVGATTAETYFGQPGLVPGPLGAGCRARRAVSWEARLMGQPPLEGPTARPGLRERGSAEPSPAPGLPAAPAPISPQALAGAPLGPFEALL